MPLFHVLLQAGVSQPRSTPPAVRLHRGGAALAGEVEEEGDGAVDGDGEAVVVADAQGAAGVVLATGGLPACDVLVWSHHLDPIY